MLDAILSLLILLGALFVFIGSLGLARLGDFYSRLHGPTKATTLGVGSLLLASLIHFSTQGDGLSLHEGLVTLFLFITAPVSAHLLAKAALHQRVRSLATVPALITDADRAELVPAPGVAGPASADQGPQSVAGRAPRQLETSASPSGDAATLLYTYRLGAAALILHQLEARFGHLPLSLRERLALADLETLFDWSLRLLHADSLESVFDGGHTPGRGESGKPKAL